MSMTIIISQRIECDPVDAKFVFVGELTAEETPLYINGEKYLSLLDDQKVNYQFSSVENSTVDKRVVYIA